jgi:hypothetical protein
MDKKKWKQVDSPLIFSLEIIFLFHPFLFGSTFNDGQMKGV